MLRVLNKDLALVTLDELGMTSAMLERFREDVLDIPTGVVLITGPTGSGKTTTLYSAIDYCNNIACKIITAEDFVHTYRIQAVFGAGGGYVGGQIVVGGHDLSLRLLLAGGRLTAIGHENRQRAPIKFAT